MADLVTQQTTLKELTRVNYFESGHYFHFCELKKHGKLISVLQLATQYALIIPKIDEQRY